MLGVTVAVEVKMDRPMFVASDFRRVEKPRLAQCSEVRISVDHGSRDVTVRQVWGVMPDGSLVLMAQRVGGGAR